jgi:tRNA(adenine34) deaminase
MKYAIKLAYKALKKKEVPVGALIVQNNKIISKGYNQSICLNDPSAHAEIIAIKNAGRKMKNYRLNNVDIYITLEPCIMCIGAILHARIKNVFFAAYSYKYSIKSIFNINILKNINIEGGFLENESKNIIKKFFEIKRNR